MNFLLRPTQNAAAELPSIHESASDTLYKPKPGTTLEGLIAEEPNPEYSPVEDHYGETVGVEGENGNVGGPCAKDESPALMEHSDVSEEEGWITIPYSMSLQILSTCVVHMVASYVSFV